MIIVIAEIVILILALAIGAVSTWGLYAPDHLIRLINDAMDQSWGIYAAVTARLLMGLALIIAAPASNYPLVFQVLGCIAIAAALVLMFAGQSNIRGLLSWIERLSKTTLRICLLFAIAFAGVLIYGIS